MPIRDFGTPKERRRDLERLTQAMYGAKPSPRQAAEPEDAVEKFYEFEKRQDHTVGLIGLIAFFGIGSVVLLMRGLPYGFVIVGILFACIVWYAGEHARERRRADAQKRRADSLAREAAQQSSSTNHPPE